MTNLTFVSNAINALVSFAIFAKVFSIYRQHRTDKLGEIFWDFGMEFLMLGIFFLNVSLPYAFLLDLKFSGFLQTLTHPWLYLSAAYLAAFVFDFHQMKGVKQAVLYIALLLGIFAMIINMAYLRPDARSVYGSLVVVRSDQPALIRALDGVLTVGVALSASFFFFFQSGRAKEELVRKRSFFIGLGTLFLAVAAVLAFFLSLSGSAWLIFFGSLTAIPALLIIFYGILYRYRELSPEYPNRTS